MIEKIIWLGHASFRIEGSPLIYIDPWRIAPQSPPADVILISHEHYDHFSLSDIERITTPNTRIITNQQVAAQMGSNYNITALRPWQSINIGSANIKATPAYTLDDYHPAIREDIGFVIAINRYDIYYAGDTDFVPDLRSIRADIAIVPVSAKEGLMTVEETVGFVKSLNPKYVVPSHYGVSEGGTYLDAKALETALNGVCKIVFPVTAV